MHGDSLHLIYWPWQVKDVHRESLTATQRWKLLRSWPMRHWTGVLLCITLLVLLCTGLVSLVRMPVRGWSSTAVSPAILPGRCETPSHMHIGNAVVSDRFIVMACLVTTGGG